MTASTKPCRSLRALSVFLLAAAIAGLGAPAPAAAQLPVGEADGVRIVRPEGSVVVVFTARAAELYRRVAGRRVSVLCTEILEDGYHSGGVTERAAKRRRPIRTGDATPGLDYCRVSLPPRTIRRDGGRTGVPRRVIVSIPLTQKGAVLLDEEKKAQALLRLTMVVDFARTKLGLHRPPTTEQLLDYAAGLVPRGYPRNLVGLAAPSATPPPGSIGYYGDGGERTAVAILSASGRRLFIETEPDGVLRTNVAGFMNDGPP